MRSCLKKTGPGETSLITSAISKHNGNQTGALKTMQVISRTRFQSGTRFDDERPFGFREAACSKWVWFMSRASRNPGAWIRFLPRKGLRDAWKLKKIFACVTGQYRAPHI